MSGQLIELIIFAAIAFFVINKLIAILGTTSEDNPSNNNSFFGESSSLKDVTNTNAGKKSAKIIKTKFSQEKTTPLKGIIVTENEKDIQEGLMNLLSKLPSFNPVKFLSNAKAAFHMIIEAGDAQDEEELQSLVDKRYLESFKSSVTLYGKITSDKKDLDAHISEIYLFGNNLFIKVLFTGKAISSKLKNLHEEWTFTKSALSSTPEWHLTNIDRPH